MKSPAIMLLVFMAVAPLPGQTEFIVNTAQDSTQRDPQIDRDAAGNYAVVWKSTNQVATGSRGDIFLQRFAANDQRIGSETLVNTVTTGDQDKPALAMNAAGDFVIAWASYTGFVSVYDIKARIYRNGVPLGNEFLVNTTTAHSQTSPDVAIDSAGNFVVVWESWFQDGGDRGVFAQRYNADGTPRGSEFRVNVTTAFSQARPAVKMMRGGKFLVIWESWKQDSPSPQGYGMYGRTFDANGSPLTTEFPLNTYTTDYQWMGDAEVLDNDDFVAAWCSWRQDGYDGGIVLQRFTAAGARIGDEVIVNRTRINYQWLPRVRALPSGGWAVVWSSWKQDGSREGVYCQLFDAAGRKRSFETQVNTYTPGFQWEPDFVVSGARHMLVVWSSWGQTGHDYEIVGRRITPEEPQGYIAPRSYLHAAGRTTSSVFVHVVDSTILTGQSYEVGFDTLPGKRALVRVINTTTGDTVMPSYPLDKGENIFYRTPTFHGISVEIIPELDLELDSLGSHMVNRSGTNVGFSITVPSAGTKLLAPIDVALVWGRTDTLPNGRYAYPGDTALGLNGQRTVVVPFTAWNTIDNARLSMLVVELAPTVNQRWDPGERIVFLTPPPWRQQSNNTHAQISTFAPSGAIVWPGVGDTNFVFSKRPLMPDDRFRFTTSRGNLVDAKEKHGGIPERFELLQNYPNPFNPGTSFEFKVPSSKLVTLKVYDLLGREVATLVNEQKSPGAYTVRWDAANVSSGIYFYRLQAGGEAVTRKMVVVK